MRGLLRPEQTLVRTNYYTSRLKKPADKVIRQSTYLDALESLPDLKIMYGMLQERPRLCRTCNSEVWLPVEKMTDVNIAIDLLVDAIDDRFDVALLISADTDLVGAVRMVRQRFPHKVVSVLFPPKRHSGELATASSGSMTIGRAKFNQSQLPEIVTGADGRQFRRPEGWK